jgi:hypothetical protein
MKNAVLWDVTSRGSCKKQRFSGMYHLHHQCDKKRRAWSTLQAHSVLQLLVTANVVPGSPILVTFITEALRSSETSLLTRATWHNTPEDGILRKLLVDIIKTDVVPGVM